MISTYIYDNRHFIEPTYLLEKAPYMILRAVMSLKYIGLRRGKRVRFCLKQNISLASCADIILPES